MNRDKLLVQIEKSLNGIDRLDNLINDGMIKLDNTPETEEDKANRLERVYKKYADIMENELGIPHEEAERLSKAFVHDHYADYI